MVAQDLDLDVYNELVDPDDPEFAPGIAQQFLSQANECLPMFVELLSKGDWKELAEKGHFLKGSAAFVGAARVKELCEEIQSWDKLIKKNEAPRTFLSERVKILPQVVRGYKEALQEYLGSSIVAQM
jgi:HPt (histidine-containing phosphotransfer) domain-containing protein